MLWFIMCIPCLKPLFDYAKGLCTTTNAAAAAAAAAAATTIEPGNQLRYLTFPFKLPLGHY